MSIIPVLLPIIGYNADSGGEGITSVLRIFQYANGTRYNAWGIAVPHTVRGTKVIDYFYSSATHHAGQATSRRLRVTEVGDFIEDVEIWSDEAKSRRDFGGGIVTASGTIIVFWVEHDVSNGNDATTTGMGWFRSTDGFSTFETHTGFPSGNAPDYSNYGNLIEHPVTGRLYHMAYGVGSPRGILSYSDDDGQTWASLSNLSFISSDSEGGLCFLGGITNLNAILGYFVRNDVNKLDFWRSSDGGSTFSFYEQVSWSSTKAVSPYVAVRPDNGNVVLLYADRDPYNYLIRAVEFDKNLLASGGTGITTSARLSLRTISESFITSHPFESSNLPGNYGYPSLAWQNNEPLVFYYDQSPYQQEPWSTANDIVQCDTIIVPYEGDVWVKARSKETNTNFPNGTNNLILEDTTIDNYGAWTNGSTFTVPKTATYDIRINLPISSGDGGTKVLNVHKNGSVIYTITEADGPIGTTGKLQGAAELDLLKGDILTFSVTVIGAASTPIMNAFSTPVAGISYGIDITNSTPLSNNIQVKIASSSQSFTNSVPAQITGTEVIDSDNTWSANQFSISKTAWYKIRVQQRMPNNVSGRRIIQVYNYENGQESQEVRRKLLYQVEDRARTGINTDTDATFYYRLNRGETVRFWFTIYGADITSVAGAFNCIEIDEI